jgi:hypothetical protein
MQSRVSLLARALALLWAGFWLFFFAVESIAWHTPVGAMMPWVAAGLFFAVVAVVPWRWELGGALLLASVGAVAAIAYAIWSPVGLPAISRALTIGVLGGPPIVAGVLFLIHDRAAASRRAA